ncbi:ATP-grasp domain-containing protein [Micromonospora schwarzwaldensis]|uniref:ATP-grasp domain-containing protein n=1 Tax=Micromonospora sp. DSM 45708 TaxID=3111767 RepID=UPI0031D9AEDC
MQPVTLLVYGKGGPALEYLLPRLTSRAIVDVLLVGEPQPWQRELLFRLCRRLHHARPDAPLADEIVAHATAVRADAVLTFSEYCVVPTAAACRRLGLPGPGPGAATSRNKLLMRRAWEAAGVPNPAFRPVDSCDDLTAACAELAGPVIVKSVLGAGSIGQATIQPGDDVEPVWRELAAAVDAAKRSGMYEHGTSSGPRFLAEEVIDSSTEGWYTEPGFGDYLSVEGLVAGGTYHPLAITARLPTIPVYVELSNQAPCVLAPELQQRIADVARRAVDALDLDTCATHTEFKLMADGTVRLLESAARAGGAAVTRELLEVYGIDLVALQHTAALGDRPDLPGRLLLPADATCAAASLSVIASDSAGKPWSVLPPFDPDRVDWSSLVSPATTVELVRGQSQEPGSPMPRYHPHNGVLGYAGLLFLRTTDPLTLRDDAIRILDGLAEAMDRGRQTP